MLLLWPDISVDECVMEEYPTCQNHYKVLYSSVKVHNIGTKYGGELIKNKTVNDNGIITNKNIIVIIAQKELGIK